jgi:hypothetical protein
MKLNIKSGLFLAFLLSTMAFATTSFASVTELTVCESGCDFANPRQAAIAAPANSVINVKNGIYSIHREIPFTRDNVKLVGESRENTIIRLRTNASKGIEITGNRVALLNLTITQQTPDATAAITVTETEAGKFPTSTAVRNVTVNTSPSVNYSNDVAGLYGKGYSLLKVTDTVFDGFAYGALFDSSETNYKNSGVTFIGTTFQNSTIAGLQFNQPETIEGRQNFHGRLVFFPGNKFLNNQVGLKFNACADSECTTPVDSNTFRGENDINNSYFEGNSTDIVNFQKADLNATQAQFVAPLQESVIDYFNQVETRVIHGCQNATGLQSSLTCNSNDLATFGTVKFVPQAFVSVPSQDDDQLAV